MAPNFASQFAGTSHTEVVAIMERAQHVTPYMVVAGYQGEPVTLFPSKPTGLHQDTVMAAWTPDGGWHKRAASFSSRPNYSKAYPLPDELIHGIRVYTDTLSFRKARRGIP